MSTGRSVDTLPLAGRGQGRGARATICGLSHPLPTSPVEGEVPGRWVGRQRAHPLLDAADGGATQRLWKHLRMDPGRARGDTEWVVWGRAREKAVHLSRPHP